MTSLRFDRETKLPLYAAAGIPEYWIVDVNGRRVEVYSQSQALESGAVYQTVQVFSEDQQFTLTINSQTFGIKPLDFLPANR
ncbi:Uma2 family endonuclease, partial [Salmonella enterica]|uniref:Uma2 family endonuclease n=1 Tax=Salmonella enterica TaxID=28901 RepID=UPI003CE9CA3E